MRTSPLHTIDARAMVLAILFGLAIVATAWTCSIVKLAVFCLFPLFLICLTNVDLRRIARRFSFVIVFLALAAIFSFFFPWQSDLSAAARIQRLRFLVFATVFGVSSAYFLAVSSHSVTLMEALLRLRVPRDLVWMAALGTRYVPLIAEEGRRIHRAALARGWSRGRRSIRIIAVMSATLIVRAFDRALQAGHAMEARGYGSPLGAPEAKPLKAIDWAFLVCYPGALLAIRLIG